MKQKRIARWLSLLLALALCLSLGTAALADTTEEDGSGTGTTALSEEAQALQDMIDALPAAEEITADNAADVEVQLDAIDAAKLVLYEAGNTEIDGLDYTKYEAACAALETLATPA
ncbi:MAG: hypothetical protein LUH36_03455, partial [Oscillospiraceae bacterium]|nr:hypothetical protein [Oscillospiraceae bacterium]